MSHARLVTITKNANNPAYQGARSGCDRLARQMGVEARHLVPQVPDSIPEQIGFLEQVLRERPDALLIAPAHPSALDQALMQVRDAGIPIVMFVGRTTRELSLSFVGSDDRRMTRDVAETVGRALGGAGTVAIIDGNPLGILYQARADGFRDGVALHPGLSVIGTRDGDFLREPAHRAMQALIEAHGVPDAVLVANDFSALGAIDALRERGARAVVGSVNATPDGIAAMRRGEMLASAAFNAMAMGCLAMEAAMRILRGETVPRHIVLPAEVVTAANLERWDVPYAERPLPVWDEAIAAQRLAA